MVAIPYDIWTQIASFLPDNALWDHRHLNRDLYDIAMDRRYRTVVVPMNFKDIENFSRDFMGFRQLKVANRVREIAYSPYASTAFPPATKLTTTTEILQTIKRRLQGIVGDRKILQHTIGRFANINSLVIRYDRLQESWIQECIPLFHTHFKLSSDNLRSIDLSVPYGRLSVNFPQDLFLPRLDTLSILLFSLAKAHDQQSLFESVSISTIAPLINRHGLTLTSLNLRLAAPHTPLAGYSMVPYLRTGTNFNMSHLLQAIKPIAHLRSVSLAIPKYTKEKFIIHFIEMHSETLKDISIDMFEPSSRIAGDLGQISLPDLKAFSIRYLSYNSRDNKAQGPEVITKFVQQCSSSLTSLSSLSASYSPAKVLALLRPVGNTFVSYTATRNLDMNLKNLTPQIMDLFVSCFPNLYEFKLYFYNFTHRERSCRVTEEFDFGFEMDRRGYSHWNLNHFNLIKRCKGQESSHAFAAVARAIPSLITFCGIERAQYLQENEAPFSALEDFFERLAAGHDIQSLAARTACANPRLSTARAQETNK